MKVNTDSSNDAATSADHVVVVLLRRGASTMGFLFGFGLLALLLAGNASADEQRSGDDGHQRAGGLVGTVTGVLSPVTEAVEPLVKSVDPLVHTATDAVAPVVRPVAEVAEPLVTPVLRPVVATVTPLLDTVAPVTEPLVGPLLHAAEPVVKPVAEGTGLTEAVSVVSGQREQENTQPQETIGQQESLLSSAPVRMSHVDAGERGHANVASADSALLTGAGLPGENPGGVPNGPVNAALGGNGAVGGSSGPHSADSAVPAAGTSPHHNSTGRGPPGAIVGQPWFGYDDRDHPS